MVYLMAKKLLFLSLILILFACSALAQETASPIKFKDLPDDHWAASAVYDLVKMGVTKGYPDGTYRGNKPITRYETAIFLSKLAKSIDSEDLKAEIKAIRDQLVDLQQDKGKFKVTGDYLGEWKYGNMLTTQASSRGAVADYRLVMTATKEFDDNANLKINLDTMDFGYFNDETNRFPGNGLLATELLDVESNLKVDNVKLQLTVGPGPKQHAADPTGSFPSEIGRVYVRPETGIKAVTNVLGLDISGGFYSLQGTTLDASGKVDMGLLTGTLSYTFNKFLALNALKVDLTGDYMSKGLLTSTDRTVRARVGLFAPLHEKVEVAGSVGIGQRTSQMMAMGSLSLKDIWDTGTVITINAAKLGSQYADERYLGEWIGLAGVDKFERPLENGTVNFGGELVQQMSDRAKFIGRGDIRLASDYKYEGPKARLTAEGGISYNIASNVDLGATYRIYHDKGIGDSSDLASVGLLYKF